MLSALLGSVWVDVRCDFATGSGLKLTSSRHMKLTAAVLRQKAPDTNPGRAYGYSWKNATFSNIEYCDAGLARAPPGVFIRSAKCLRKYRSSLKVDGTYQVPDR